jgi:hypothetical protein
MYRPVPRKNVRFGSLADVRIAKSHVRFAPESGHLQCTSACPLRAISGHKQSAALPWLDDALKKNRAREGAVKKGGFTHRHLTGL